MSDTLERQSVAEVSLNEPGAGNAIIGAVWPPVLLGTALLGVWYLISYAALDPTRRFLLPPPHEVIAEGFLADGIWKDQLASLWQTTLVATEGLAIAILIGVALAIVMSQSNTIENAVFPYAVILQAVPILALVPLISFWIGTGKSARIVVCIIIALFPIILNTLFGLQSADQGLHDLFTLHGVSRITRLRKLMLPAALPAIFAGLRISAGLSVIGAIVGDFFFGAGVTGIGQDIKKYSAQLQGPELFAAVLLACGLGVAVFLLFGWIRNRTISKWYDATS